MPTRRRMRARGTGNRAGSTMISRGCFWWVRTILLSILALIVLWVVVLMMWTNSPPRQIDLGSMQPAQLIASPVPTPSWIRSITPPLGTVLKADEEVSVCLERWRFGWMPRPFFGFYLGEREIMDVRHSERYYPDIISSDDDYTIFCFETVFQPGNHVLTYTEEVMYLELRRYSWAYRVR